MKNKEKFAKEIADIAIKGHTIALTKTGNFVACIHTDCKRCIFSHYSNPNKKCSKVREEWGEKEYIEPLLDKVEKEYLSTIIKPFKDRVLYIEKCGGTDLEYIRIYYNEIKKDCQNAMGLPYFKKGTMYKNMKLRKRYTLKDLDL